MDYVGAVAMLIVGFLGAVVAGNIASAKRRARLGRPEVAAARTDLESRIAVLEEKGKTIDSKLLTRWDVATVVFSLLGALGALTAVLRFALGK